MNSRFIIIAILIMIKVVGVASHARANFCESMYNNTDDAFFAVRHGRLICQFRTTPTWE